MNIFDHAHPKIIELTFSFDHAYSKNVQSAFNLRKLVNLHVKN